MCKSDSKTFNSFVKDRKKDDMAPPDEPGYIAVECYGREAVRGGGWCTYAVCKDEVDNSWTPETKMIHNKKEDEDEEEKKDEDEENKTSNKKRKSTSSKTETKKKQKNNDSEAVEVPVETDPEKLQNSKRGGLNLQFSRSAVSLATDPKVAAAARDAFTACADRADKIFLSREYTKEAHMRVKEENGKYRPVTMFRHRIMRDRVVLNFGGGEFEGIGASYSFKNKILRDSDGDKIEYVWLCSMEIQNTFVINSLETTNTLISISRTTPQVHEFPGPEKRSKTETKRS